MENLMKQFPYHPLYGLPDMWRAEIVAFAECTDVQTAASTYNVGKSTIYRWRAVVRAIDRSTG
jgi:hypothetical protein